MTSTLFSALKDDIGAIFAHLFSAEIERLKGRIVRLKAKNARLERENVILRVKIERLTVPAGMVRAGHCLFKKLENGRISAVPYCPKCYSLIPASGRALQCACGFRLQLQALSESLGLLDKGHYSEIPVP